MKALMTFFAGITSVIAAGVLVIAYSLVSGRAVPADGVVSRPMYPGDRAMLVDDASRYAVPAGMTTAYPDYRSVPASDVRAVPAVETYTPPRRTTYAARPVSSTTRQVQVERSRGRDWTKTAMIIGGSSAAGAGLGAIFGGKKGALIGAAIGGGASTLYEATKR
jgi:hypothetical protein